MQKCEANRTNFLPILCLVRRWPIQMEGEKEQNTSKLEATTKTQHQFWSSDDGFNCGHTQTTPLPWSLNHGNNTQLIYKTTRLFHLAGPLTTLQAYPNTTLRCLTPFCPSVIQ